MWLVQLKITYFMSSAISGEGRKVKMLYSNGNCSALAWRNVYLTSKLFSDADKLNPQLNKFLTTHWLNESVSLNNLFFPVSVDDGVQAFKCSATHQVTNAFLLYTEPLDLIVDMEEEWVVAGRVVTGSH